MQLFSIYKCQKGLHGLGFCKIKYFLKINHFLLTFFIPSNKSYEKDVIYIKDKYPYNALIYKGIKCLHVIYFPIFYHLIKHKSLNH